MVLLALLAGNWRQRALIWIACCGLRQPRFAAVGVAIHRGTSTYRGRARHADPEPLSGCFQHRSDLAFFSLLQHLMSTALNTQALLALPVLMAGVMMPRLVALAVAAVASLNLLAAAWIQGTLTATLSAQLTTEAEQTGL